MMLSDEYVLLLIVFAAVVVVIIMLVLFCVRFKEPMCGGGDQLCKCSGNET